jgi:hypothetical protein
MFDMGMSYIVNDTSRRIHRKIRKVGKFGIEREPAWALVQRTDVEVRLQPSTHSRELV